MADRLAGLPEAKALRLQPGDIVILETDRNMSGAEAARLRDQAKARFPAHDVLVLTGGVSVGSRAPAETLDALADALWPRIRDRMLAAARRPGPVGLV